MLSLMQKLISINPQNSKSLISEDHYIIDNILENLLNAEIIKIIFTS